MMYLRLLFIACLVLLPVSSIAADDGYGYPIAGSYEATILGTPASLMPKFPPKMRTRQLVLDVIPDRQRPPIFFYDEGLRCTFAYQKQKAPLVFLIAGAGASDRSTKMLTMMKGVINEGTGVRLRYKYGITAPMAGKTGTTNQNSDGWFMGVTPRLVAGMWVGCEDRAIHFDMTADGQGANMALPIYANFIKKVYADPRLGYTQTEDFPPSPKYTDPCAESSFIQNYQTEPAEESIDESFQ